MQQYNLLHQKITLIIFFYLAKLQRSQIPLEKDFKQNEAP
jgi:hypothetical protein